MEMKFTLVLSVIILKSFVLSQSPASEQLKVKNDNAIHNYGNLTSIRELLELFSIEYIGTDWMNIHKSLSHQCSRDTTKYLNGLSQRRVWAIKMDDASGHYSTGYFWGNNYWTGSMSLCRSIFKTSESDEFTRKESSNIGLTFLHGNTGGSQIKHQNPPFLPRFSVIKLAFNDSFTTPNPRTIHIGVCLPSSCTYDDVFALAERASRSVDTRTITVKDIRIPNGDNFSLWKDNTFIIMLIVTGFVGLLVLWATVYDNMLTKRATKFTKEVHSDSSGLNCTTYVLSNDKEDKKNNIVGIAMPNGVNNNNSDENLAIEIVEEEKLSLSEEILLSFSLTTNFRAICDQAVGSDTIPCIHGIRALSMAWIILGHTCIISFKYSDNMELRKVVEQSFFFQTISNGAFSVDTFFFISGFLVSFLYFRTNAKGKLDKLSKNVNEFTQGSLHFFGLVAYRYARLTVPYLYVLGIVEVSMKYFASNSIFDPPTEDHINCPKYWWRNLLYINTLFPVKDMCMLWSWYLANDTQFYIIGAIILIVAVRHFKFAATTLCIFMISAWITTGVIAFNNNHMPNTDDPLALFDKIYDKPWTRLGPYLVGMCVGYILFKTNCKIRFTKAQLIVGWTLSTGVILYLLYGLFKIELTKVAAAAYSSLSHSAWAMALAWVVIACSTGHGGFLNSILSYTPLYPFSRVTYCAYLVHPIIIRAFALNSDAPVHMGTDTMVVIFLGQTFASYLLSFIVSLGFEAPICALLRILSKMGAQNNKQK